MNQQAAELPNTQDIHSDTDRLCKLLDLTQKRDARTRTIVLGLIGVMLLLVALVAWSVWRSTRIDAAAKEDANWRESLAAMSHQPDGWNGGVAASMLQAFLSSRRHHEDAANASRLYLRRLSD